MLDLLDEGAKEFVKHHNNILRLSDDVEEFENPGH
jgi:hypothetical protein